MFSCRLLLLVLFLALSGACRIGGDADLDAPAAEQDRTYTNPVDSLIMGDPFVLKQGGRYYLFGTTDPAEGFRCYTSSNLVEWTESGFAYRMTDRSWAAPPFWAPEVAVYDNRFFLTYSGRDKESGRLLTALAVSDSPEGPYQDLHAPWFDQGYSAIDSHIFVDRDGRPYLYFSRNGMREGYSFGIIYGARLRADLSGLDGEPLLLMEAEQDWEKIDFAHNRANEGPFVIEHAGRYVMTYSANHTFRPGYGIGFATADRPLGPWTKSALNPIAGTDMAAGYSGAGHNSITFSPDGSEMFVVYHTHADPAFPGNQKRTVNIDRIVFDSTGQLIIHGPTRTPQPFPSGAR